eukprot:jgi/Undpi1/2058/HiC_scaffold_12.g05444.m1
MQKEKASLQASQQEAVKRAGDADCVAASAKEEIVIHQQQIARVQQVLANPGDVMAIIHKLSGQRWADHIPELRNVVDMIFDVLFCRGSQKGYRTGLGKNVLRRGGEREEGGGGGRTGREEEDDVNPMAEGPRNSVKTEWTKTFEAVEAKARALKKKFGDVSGEGTSKPKMSCCRGGGCKHRRTTVAAETNSSIRAQGNSLL